MSLPQIATARTAAEARIWDIGCGFMFSQALYVAAKLGIADLLKDGPKTSEELAKSAEVYAPSLNRVLRLLASVGIFIEREDGRFDLTPPAACLEKGPDSMGALPIMWCGAFFRAAGDLLYSVRTGKPSFDHVHGVGAFEYLAQHPELVFDEAMRQASAQWNPAVVRAYDFSKFNRVVDVGGGQGGLVSLILKSNPHLRGVVFDSPCVVEGARRRIEEAGLFGRCEVIAGDFFESVPAGGDAYILSVVIHDWDDERAIAILRNCRKAMANTGTLLLAEVTILPSNQPDFSKVADVFMMTIGGRERTEAEFRDLLTKAGFQLLRSFPTESILRIIEARPVR